MPCPRRRTRAHRHRPARRLASHTLEAGAMVCASPLELLRVAPNSVARASVSAAVGQPGHKLINLHWEIRLPFSSLHADRSPAYCIELHCRDQSLKSLNPMLNPSLICPFRSPSYSMNASFCLQCKPTLPAGRTHGSRLQRVILT